MTLPHTPAAWANHISQMLIAVQKIHGLPRFPVDVTSIAKEFSKQVFPKEPITLVKGIGMADSLEGALFPNPNESGEWGILYNSDIKSIGRQNYTLAHEFGHYLLHRHISPKGIECRKADMFEWNSEEGKIEAEANVFASYLLMPLDDFREQIKGKQVTLEILQQLASRYRVSISAAVLKWLSFTDQRAMLVISKDGFIDWARSSKPLLRSNVYFAARQVITPLPEASLAAKANREFDNLSGVKHPKGVWNIDEPVTEMTIVSTNMTLTLLLYPKDKPWNAKQSDEDDEEGLLEDTHSRFLNFNKRMTE